MKILRKNLLFIFVLLIGITINVKAENFNYYLSNGESNYEIGDTNKVTNLKRGDIVKITAIIDNKDNVNNLRINGGKLTVRWDSKIFSLKEINGKYYDDSISDISGLTIGSINRESSKIVMNDISSTGFIKSGMNKIVQFNFLVLQTADATSGRIYRMDGEDSLKCYSLEEDKTINCGESLYSEFKYNVTKSTINKLSSIKIDGHELEYFNEDNTDYDIEVESTTTKIKIDVTKKDNKATITGDYGEKTLKYGLNKFIVYVISESGEQNKYNINVNRIDNRSSVNTLKTLSLSEGELDFNPNVTEYTVNVSNEIEKIKITSSLTDSKSKYVVDYQNKEIELIEGSNKVQIKVISEKGEENTYTININRALSSNNSLKSLTVNDEKIKLNEDEFIYNVTVETDVDEVVIKAIPNDSKATVELKDNYPLEIGENEINIKVIAADGQEASYIVNVTRKKALSKDSLLTSLIIKGYEINFKPTVTLYDLKIEDDINELEIETTAEDENAIVEIEGNKKLENGSIIKINVKAEDGSFTRYFINIEKGSRGIPSYIIVIIVLFILLAICIGIIIYRKKRQEKKEFDKLDEIKDKEEFTPKEELDTEEDNLPETKEEDTFGEDANDTDEEYVGAHEDKHKVENEDKEKDV